MTPLLLLVLALTPEVSSSRFLSEYPRENRILQDDLAVATGEARLYAVKNGKVDPVGTEVKFATTADCAKYQFENRVTRPAKAAGIWETVCSREQQRIFMLRKSPHDQKYIIKSLGDDPANQGVFEVVFGKYLNAPWALGPSDLASLMRKGNIQVAEEREVVESGRTLIQVNLKHNFAKDQFDQYQMTFDPSLHWAVVRSEEFPHATGGRRTDFFEIDYAPALDGRTYPKKVWYTDIGDKQTMCEFVRVEARETPRSEFGLEFYGLVDPERKSNPFWPYWIWLGLALTAVALLIAGRWLRLRSTRLAAIGVSHG